MSRYRIKIAVSLITSFIVVFFLNREVFFAGTPRVRPDVPMRIVQAPQYISSQINTIFSSMKRKTGEGPSPTPTPFGEGVPLPTSRRENGTQPFPVSTIPPGMPANPTATVQPTTSQPSTQPTASPTQRPSAPPQPSQPNQTTNIAFAECLTSKGMKYYYNSSCGACLWQKQQFGDQAFAKLTAINCDTQTQTCYGKGIGKGPAWEKGSGEMVGGAKNFQMLSTMSGCPQPGS